MKQSAKSKKIAPKIDRQERSNRERTAEKNLQMFHVKHFCHRCSTEMNVVRKNDMRELRRTFFMWASNLHMPFAYNKEDLFQKEDYFKKSHQKSRIKKVRLRMKADDPTRKYLQKIVSKELLLQNRLLKTHIRKENRLSLCCVMQRWNFLHNTYI